MKHTKKLVSLVLALVMALALATTASAAAVTVTNNSDRTYDAYQIFKGDVADVSGSPVLSNVQWGDGISSGNTFLAALKASTNFGSGNSNDFYSCSDAAGVADVLANKNSTAGYGQKFADFAVGYLSSTKVNIAASSTSATLAPGYYLLKDVTTGLAAGEARTSALIRVVGSTLTIADKTSAASSPVINKTVTGETAALVGVSTDAEIPFTVTVTLPANFDSYAAYKLIFKDTGTNLYFVTTELAVKVVRDNTTIGTLTKTTDYTASVGTSNLANNVLTVTINDLVDACDGVKAGDKVVLSYGARIFDPTVAASNSVVVSHSSDPYSTDPEDPMQDTPAGPDSEVDVTSFSLNVINQTSGGAKLSGAEFVLTKEISGVMKYARLNSSHGLDQWVATEATATKLTTDADGKVTFYGLDDQVEYTLKEVKAADGYNRAKDVKFKINMPADETTLATTDNPSVTGTAYNALQVTIENNAGATLPETGGVGTTLFYIIGGVLVVGAVVVLITRKRVGEDR